MFSAAVEATEARSSRAKRWVHVLLRLGSAAGKVVATPRFSLTLFLTVLAIETAAVLLRASTKPLWCDEIITLRLSALQPFSSLWSALQAGADGMPPGYYAMVRLARILPGEPHILIRLPSLIGYLLALTGVYLFACRRLPAIAGLTGVLLIALSPFREYAWEARCYAPLVGCLAMAAVSWQRIGERRFSTMGFTAFLALAVLSNHLAVVAISVFGMAELVRTFSQREVRWSVWASCLAATTPFLSSLPILLRLREVYGGNYWARPSWLTTVSTFGHYTGLDPLTALVLTSFLGLAIGAGCLRMVRRHQEGLTDIILVACLLLYPVLLVTIARIHGDGYTYRYGWPGLLGLVLGSLYLSRSFWRRPNSAFLLAALLTGFAYQVGLDLKLLTRVGSAPVDERWIALAEVIRDEPDVPVVIASGVHYIDAKEYSPPELRPRLLSVLDPTNAVRLAGADTVDKGFPILARFVPIRFQGLAAFEASQRRFVLYSGGFLDWITPYLIERKYRMRLLANVSGGGIYLVEP